MRKALKISGGIFLVLLLLLIVTPFLFQDRIKQGVKALASRSLRSEVNFTDMNLSFFSHFPNLSLTLSDFSLNGSSPFQKDTLISAHEIAFGVNLMSLFGKTILITRVYLDQARINILYNEKGAANFNVFQPADTLAVAKDTTQPGAELNIEHIIFKDCRVVYSDPALLLRIVVHGFDYSGTSKLTADIFDLTSEITIDSLDLVYGNVKYVDAKPVTALLKTKVNTKDLTVDFEKNDLKIKDIPLQFHGKFNFEKEGYQVNLNLLSIMEKEFFSARFKIRQTTNPWIFAKVNASIDLEKWSKALDVSAVALRGTYELNLNAEGYYITGPVQKGIRKETDTIILSIPKFEMMSKLSNGYLKYQRLPQALSNINFTLNASCPDENYKNISLRLENLNADFLKNKIRGYIKLNNPDGVSIDADLMAGINLAELKQVVPMDSLMLSGMLDFNLKVKGDYFPEKKKFPVTTVNLNLKDGSLQTKYYPHPLEKIELVAEIVNRTGTSGDLAVKIQPLAFRFEGKPFTLTADLENFNDLKYDLQSQGVIDLGKVYRVFSREGMELDGTIETDVSLKGKQSDAIAGRISKLNNRGTLKIRNIELQDEDYPKPFIIKSGDFRFDQDKIWFGNFLATYGSSDFRLKGYIQNAINFILSQGAPLRGKFKLNSEFIDVDEFMVFAPSEGPKPGEPISVPTGSKGFVSSGESGVIILPGDMDIDFSAEVKKTLFKGLAINDLKGEIDLKEGILVLSEVSLSLIGCTVGLDATYGSVTPEKGFFDLHIRANDFDIKRAYNEVAMIREMAPSAEKAEGIVSLDYKVKGMLNAEMFPVLSSLDGGGTVSLRKVKVNGLKLFTDISKSTQKESLNNPDLTNVVIKSTIKNNTVTLEQFKFRVKGIRLRVSGTTTFDQQLNLRIRLGLPPLGIVGIPLKISGPMENLKIRYGRGNDDSEISDSDYTDEPPKEMLDRIKHAKEEDAEEEPELPK